MDPLTLQTVAHFAGGTFQQGDAYQLCLGIATDSRTIVAGELFLALNGENYKGDQFVYNALERGAIGVIVPTGYTNPLPRSVGAITVEDCLAAYQRIAGQYRSTLPMKVVAITGSNGKTSTKDFTAAVLSEKYRVVKTIGNYNNHVGVPRTLLSASVHDEIGILEVGMNHPGEIAPLASIVRPDIAVITNVGTAHIEFLKTRTAIAEEKGVLAEAVNSSGYVVLSEEDEFSNCIAERTAATKVMVGFNKGEIRAEGIQQDKYGTKFTLVADQQRISAQISVPGKHMVLNAMFAVAVGRISGLSLEDCANRLKSAVLTEHRLEMKTVGSLRILDDSYNANPDSMVAALEVLASMPTDGRRIAVLGKMGELGVESNAGHLKVGRSAARKQIDQIIGVGIEGGLIVEGALSEGSEHAIVVPDVEYASAWLNKFARPDDLILLKGSRSAGMERIMATLSTKNPQGTVV